VLVFFFDFLLNGYIVEPFRIMTDANSSTLQPDFSSSVARLSLRLDEADAGTSTIPMIDDTPSPDGGGGEEGNAGDVVVNGAPAAAGSVAGVLPWDGFASWIHCVCVVTFDLELGQALEVS
jgi:hypothetical protein